MFNEMTVSCSLTHSECSICDVSKRLFLCLKFGYTAGNIFVHQDTLTLAKGSKIWVNLVSKRQKTTSRADSK